MERIVRSFLTIRWVLFVAPLLLGFGFAVTGNTTAQAVEDDDEEQGHDHLGEARRLLLAGDIPAAEAALDEARTHEDTDPTELRILEGLVKQQQGNHRDAVWVFREVLEGHPERVSVHLYLGQSLYGLGDLEGAHQELVAGEGVGDRIAGYFVLRAAIEGELDRSHDAYHTLENGLSRFDGSPDLLRQQALVLIRLGLVQAAMDPARRYLDAAPDDPYAYLVLAEALRTNGQIEPNNLLLEEALLRFPDDPDVISRLAYGYAAAGRPSTSARMFLRGHAVSPQYDYEIAEQLRVAGQHRRALGFNARVEDPQRKLVQRLAIYSAMERHDLAAALTPMIERLPDVDDTTRYHLAYACYMAGDHQAVRRLVDTIEDSWLRDSGEELVRLGEGG